MLETVRCLKQVRNDSQSSGKKKEEVQDKILARFYGLDFSSNLLTKT
jgi:hypothetical protein